MEYNILLALLAVSQFLDWWTTKQALTLGFVEANPITLSILDTGGFILLFLFKAFLVAAAWYVSLNSKLLWLVVILTLGTTLWNVWHLYYFSPQYF